MKNMNNEEAYIRSRMNGNNPFKVPEGYFDNLTSRIMAGIPEGLPKGFADKKAPAPVISLKERLRPLLYAAAVIVMAVCSLTIYFNQDETADADQSIVAQTSANGDTYFEEMADYTMMDSYEIYACLTND